MANLVQVKMEQFYAIIGPLERLDGGVSISDFPTKVMRHRIQQWKDEGIPVWGYGYEEIAAIETLLSEPYPHPEKYYVDERLIPSQQ